MSKKIYTKIGDDGKTSLFNGHRSSKNSDYFQVLGDIDELNAQLAVVREHCIIAKNGLAVHISDIQSRLFDLGAHVATPLSSSKPAQIVRTNFGPEHTVKLEQLIDKLEEKLTPLTNFILPSGGFSAAHFHVARTICRRAERQLVLLIEREDASQTTLTFLNRLSDTLFVMARTAGTHENIKEALWSK